MIMNRFSASRLSLMTILSILLASCGGDNGTSIISTPPALEDGPGGQFFGFYAESNEVNDPDPAVGGIYLDIPGSEGNVKGRMSFQYADCQRTNALTILARKLTRYITAGTATGTIDSVSTSMPDNTVLFTFTGDYSRSSNNYNGNYDRGSRGNEQRTESNCITYTLAQKGHWTVYPADTVFPSGFSLNKDGQLLYWQNAPTNAVRALVDIINPDAVGTSSDNGFVLQRSIKPIIAPSMTLPMLQSGKSYIVLVELFDNSNNIVAFKQQPFTF